MASAEEIVSWFEERRGNSAQIIEAMREIRDISNGDIVVPLPEMDQSEKPAVANLVAEGIDQTAMRVASTLPNLFCPAVDPRKAEGVRSVAYAEIRRKAILGWWQHSKMRRVHRRKARFLCAYGAAPVMIRPDFEHGVPKWQVRDPLTAFPAPSEYLDDDEPDNVIFAFRKPLSWLMEHYPVEARMLSKGYDPKPQDLFEILEYNDAEEHVLVAVGRTDSQSQLGGFPTQYASGTAPFVELDRAPNRAGMCLAVSAQRITLDRLCGQFNQLTGMYQTQAKLMALELIAVEKSVFPDLALVPFQQGQTPKLVAGRWIDGREGKVNVLQNGTIEAVNLQPGFKTGEAMDRLERGQRIGGIAPQWGGENPTNIRTGRAAEVNMSAQIDFRIQEYQEQNADSMVAENRRAVAVAKAYFGNQKKSFYISMKNAQGHVDYVPDEHFETSDNEVSYSMPGSDVNSMIVGIGQRVGLNMMSRKTGMWLDPLVDDPEFEHDQVVAEGLEGALLASLQQMASQGAIPPSDVASITQKVLEENKSLTQAVSETQEEAQERQSEQVEPGAPEAQPGIAQPGTGAESPESVQEPPQGMANLQRLLFSLRQPQGASGGGTSPAAQGAAA